MPEQDQSAPPLPPDVRQQQGPDVGKYAKAVMQGQGGQSAAGAQQQTSMQYVQQKIAEIAGALKEVAQVISVEKPALMPVLKKMAGIGKVLEQSVNEASQGQGAAIPQGSEPGAGNPQEGPATMS